MTETLLSESATASLITYLYYLMLTAHISLFVDMSAIQKHPVSRINHFIASALSALISSVLTSNISFSSTFTETLTGLIAAVVASAAITLVIQRVIRIQ